MKTRFIILAAFLAAVMGGATARADLTLVGHLDNKHGTTGGVSYSGCWGWVGPDGREYALLTTATGTAIIDITDTSDIHEIVHIPGPTSLWREVRTYRDRAYVVTEAGGGTQIIDLSPLPYTALLVKSFTYTDGSRNTGRAHTLEIFDGHLYLNGCATWGTTSERGAVIFSLEDPDNPAFVGEYSPDYFHDSYVRNDTLFGAAIYSGGGIYIADISDKSKPVPIGKIGYSGSGTHNLWQTVDGRYVLSTDEIGTTQKTLKIWDLDSLPSVPSAPSATYTVSPTDIVHNVFVRGDYAYVAWYTAGIAVVDITDPESPFTAGSYDTSVEPPGSYEGVWAVYPYYWSGKVIAGDMQNGLYVFTFDSLAPRTPVELIGPADGSFLDASLPVAFSWTRAADPAKDPHTYRLVVSGPGFDTTINTGTDTACILGPSVLGGPGGYSWRVLTVDEVNSISSPETAAFVRSSVMVLQPGGGESFLMGEEATVSWTSFSDSVEISWSPDGGSTWEAVATVPAVPDTFNWTVPATPTFTGMVRVRDVADTANTDNSDGHFTVYAATVAPVAGWNLLSAPSDPLNDSITVNFPGAASAAFVYERGYRETATLPRGRGFWMKYAEAAAERSVGFRVEADTLPVSEAWNIIGSLTVPVPAAGAETFPPSMTLSSFYGYSSDSGYFEADTIRPGAGYWVKSDRAGDIILTAGAMKADPGRLSGPGAELSRLEFRSGGKTRALYFRAAEPSGGEAPSGELPPPPPGGFDVRFGDNTAVHSGAGTAPGRIIVRGATGPVSVSLRNSGSDGEGWILVETTEGNGDLLRDLSAGPVVINTRGGDVTCTLLRSSGIAAPGTFRLNPNHPNPFNPSTVITYELAEAVEVDLSVYNLLGAKVATLAEGPQDAGVKRVVFSGEGLPSGVYFYRLRAGGFVGVGKMTLSK